MASAAGIIKIPAPERVACKAGSGVTTAPAQQCVGDSAPHHASFLHVSNRLVPEYLLFCNGTIPFSLVPSKIAL